MSAPQPSPELVEAARSAVGAMLAYRRGDRSGMRALTQEYNINPEPLITALFHIADGFADKVGQLEGRDGEEVLQELAERFARR